jgi:hypothetical protein
MKNMKDSLKEKEEKLIKQIEKSKIKLRQIQNKRINEFGKLACDHGLHNFDKKLVKAALAEISKELSAQALSK